MPIKVGEAIPAVSFMRMDTEGPVRVTSDELCDGTMVVIFGLPGAFTPVCSAQHLPGFIEKADELKGRGIDAIACVSVNDPFVMAAWGRIHDAQEKVLMLADHDGTFTRGLELEIDLSDFGLGERSKRYSMIVENGVVKQINIEDDILAHDVSSAETILTQI